MNRIVFILIAFVLCLPANVQTVAAEPAGLAHGSVTTVQPALGYIHWDVSPFIYEGEHFAIGWYGTLWVLGLVGLLITLLITFRHDGVPQQYAFLTFMITLVLAIFFAHLFQGLFYEWYIGADGHCHNYYFGHPWLFLDITHGGFSSHGVIVGALLAGVVSAKFLRCGVWYIVDRIMMGLFWIAVAVRVGNFINGEIYGIETSLPWGVVFGDDAYPSHPTQIYELLTYLLVMAIGWGMYLRKGKPYPAGLITGVMCSLVALLRILIEFVKLPQMRIEATWMLNIGQWLSVPMAIFGIWLCFYVLEKETVVVAADKKKKQNKK